VIVGFPVALLQAGSAEQLFGVIAAEIPIAILAISLFVGLRRRRLWAWQLNWLWLLLDVFGMAAQRVPKESAAEEAVGYYVGAVLAYAVVWGTPNYVYFKKRRLLFSGPQIFENGLLQESSEHCFVLSGPLLALPKQQRKPLAKDSTQPRWWRFLR
jgi:hypothetical protein